MERNEKEQKGMVLEITYRSRSNGRERKGTEGNGREWKGTEGNGKERKGMEGNGKGTEREGFVEELSRFWREVYKIYPFLNMRILKQ